MNNYSYEGLCKILQNQNINDANELIEFMKEWDINNDTYILNLLKIFHNKYNGITHSYYKNIIFEHNNYKIVLIYWCPYSYSRVHSHPSAGCIMKVIEGYIDIDIYDDSDFSILQNIGSKLKIAGDIEYIKGKHGIHRISNDTNSDSAITIHIYISK
jgi:hypothetical protein